MRFQFTEAQEAFRKEVVSFLEAEKAADDTPWRSYELIGPSSIEFSRKLAVKNWIGITWPKQYGGRELSYVDKCILSEEMSRFQAPIGYHFLGERQVGPALIKFGTDWQKEFFLPRITAAEEKSSFCLLFSEPDAGSDLAACSTTAKQDGDHYIINGQKTWNSGAHHADWGWLLAKTDFFETTPKHMAFSEFMVDLTLPGITIKPITNMAGEHSFNEVFFDNVAIHKKYLVGIENMGFKQIMAQIDYERSGPERLLQNFPVYEQTIAHIQKMDAASKTHGLYAWIRDAAAQLEIEYTIGRLMCYQTAWTIDQKKVATSQAAMSKAFCTQFAKRLNDVATKIIGPTSQIMSGSDWAPLEADIARSFLWGPSYTLQGGSVEILKNIIAQRGLGLPRN
jgi:alkylation response protein AidB-like acyl-CoA dehydrogenase